MLPAVAQGAIGIACREGDDRSGACPAPPQPALSVLMLMLMLLLHIVGRSSAPVCTFAHPATAPAVPSSSCLPARLQLPPLLP